MSNFMCRPNVIVYLDVTPEISMERIRERSRGCEVGIDVGYLTALRANYEEFLGEVSRVIPVIRVDYDEFWDTEKLATAVTRQYTDANFLLELPRIT